ncbi:MAG: LTA synthase family protein [Proteobacteria bacterium]|nr:LTA synthase family protein [Pseudomonadota bacterium]
MKADPSTRRESIELNELEFAVNIFLLGGLAGTAIEAALYFRSGPFGTPYAPAFWREFGLSVFYEWYGMAIISLPFFILACLRKTGLRQFATKIKKGLHISLIFVSLMIGHADNEIQRFMGIRLSIDYLKTYGRIDKTPSAVGHAIAEDPGGAYSVYWLISIPLIFVIGAIVVNRRLSFRLIRKHSRIAVICGAVVFYIIPTISWNATPEASLILDKVEPPTILVYREIKGIFAEKRNFKNFENTAQVFQNWWRHQDTEKRWTFRTPGYPLYKNHIGTCPAKIGRPTNFIIIQLETFRAKDMKLFNPELDIAPTPFLDQLSRTSQSAYWPRFYCNSLPTVYTFMVLHTGLLPHTQKRAATAFIDTRFDAMPEMLRRHGYHTSFFSGPNPDWDNERFWLNKWYDHVVFDPAHREEDRPLFRQAASYLKARGDKSEPFLATVVSITNHVPFRSPEPSFNITDSETTFDRLHNTMHYTDDVVREFYEAIKDEPWFERTILIITGDHGYDLGDRGWVIGHTNLRHESTWVPLIIHGSHQALPRGIQYTVGSHIDVAPTVMDLAGICDDNSFMGHSLLGAQEDLSSAVMVRTGSVAYETKRFSAFFPKGAAPMMFNPEDILQQKDIAATNQGTAADYLATVRALLEITDYAYELNRVTPK